MNYVPVVLTHIWQFTGLVQTHRYFSHSSDHIKQYRDNLILKIWYWTRLFISSYQNTTLEGSIRSTKYLSWVPCRILPPRCLDGMQTFISFKYITVRTLHVSCCYIHISYTTQLNSTNVIIDFLDGPLLFIGDLYYMKHSVCTLERQIFAGHADSYILFLNIVVHSECYT